MAQNDDIRYLNPVNVEVKKKKYCRFKKAGIKYVDYKDAEFLKKFVTKKVLPTRRLPYRATNSALPDFIK